MTAIISASLRKDAMSQPITDPAKLVEGVYSLADLLVVADSAINGTYGRRGIWPDLPPEREAALDAILGTYDFLMKAKALREYADAWQAQLDAEQIPEHVV